MSIGDPGPYVEMDGPLVWVPRGVPYLRARQIAKEAAQYGERLHYLGQTEADLLGFSYNCRCDEVCEKAYEDDEPTGEHPCRVRAWKFEIVE